MTDRRRKVECPVCGAKVRQIGKHTTQKHPPKEKKWASTR